MDDQYQLYHQGSVEVSVMRVVICDPANKLTPIPLHKRNTLGVCAVSPLIHLRLMQADGSWISVDGNLAGGVRGVTFQDTGAPPGESPTNGRRMGACVRMCA
jgi:hypothetical protein